MRILLTGSKGQLGRCFKERLPENWELIAADSKTLNITDAATVANMVKSFQPDAIVNTAGYTAVDKAEKESETAFTINGEAVGNLAAAARNAQAKFLHISTDYVFSGDAKVPYAETSSPNPQNNYGRSKLAGELLALAANPNSVVLRTSWIFSEYGNNFVRTMLDAAKEREELYLVDDQISIPTYAGDLAQAMVDILKRKDFPAGIFHYCGDHSVNRYEFAEAIFAVAKAENPDFRIPHLHAISGAGFPAPADRPGYSVLDCNKISRELGIQAGDWEKALQNVVPALLAE